MSPLKTTAWEAMGGSVGGRARTIQRRYAADFPYLV